MIGAMTYELLLEAVLKFRLNNLELVETGTATPDIVSGDVMRYICGTFPGNCTGSKAQLSAAAQGNFGPASSNSRVNYRRPLTRIEDWLTGLQEHNLVWVDQATAQARAEICVNCSMNQNWRTGCGPCNENALRRELLVRGSHQTALDPKLKACMAFGTLNELSVWLVNDYAKPRPRVNIPQACWKLSVTAQ